MAISKYNQSLDFTALALAAAANGQHVQAGKLLLKAATSPDVGRAVATLEASNAQAFAAHQKAVTASKKAKVAAKTKVKAFDMGDEAEIDDLIGGGGEEDAGFDEVDEDVEVDEEVDAADDSEDDGDDEAFNEAFASVLAGMKGGAKPAKKK